MLLAGLYCIFWNQVHLGSFAVSDWEHLDARGSSDQVLKDMAGFWSQNVWVFLSGRCGHSVTLSGPSVISGSWFPRVHSEGYLQ